MISLLHFFLSLFASPFKSRSRLEAENAALRHQLTVLQRKVRGRLHFTNSDRLFFIQLYRWFPSILEAMTIVRPETSVRWHRAGFRRYWRCKSRSLGGRPRIAVDLQALIQRMSIENRLWGAPHIHGELLKLGFVVGQSTVAKYMAKPGAPSGQSWRHLLAQSRTAHRSHGPVRGSQHLLQPALCFGHRPAGPPRACLDQRNTGGRALLLCLLCAEAGWLILVNAWLWLERAYLKPRLFLRV
jgi:hypothetical protein